jgi:thioredoxin 2
VSSHDRVSSEHRRLSELRPQESRTQRGARHAAVQQLPPAGAVADAATIPVLVDLWAPWCGPCRMVSPVLEKLARECAGRVKLVKVNVDASPVTAQRFRAQGIPMLVVLREGRVVAEHVGAAGEQVLRPWLEDALSRVSA